MTNFEFLGLEPIENVITCLNFRMDRVVFFGYHDVVASRRRTTENFLKKYCGVSEVVFCEVSTKGMEPVLKTMEQQIQREIQQKNNVSFDITGGEDLALVAFGMLAQQMHLSMHKFDVETNALIEFGADAEKRISKMAAPQKVQMNLDMYIELKGAKIKHGTRYGADINNISRGQLEGIWAVASENIEYWNHFSSLLGTELKCFDNLQVYEPAQTVIDWTKSSNGRPTVGVINRMLDALQKCGAIKNLVHGDGRYSFEYANSQIEDCLCKGGKILEQVVYLREREHSDDCMTSVHIDWDGVIHYGPGEDVLNEIDVLSITGNIPTFISCKTGKMNRDQALLPLYELETVVKRFGGRYAKKVLVSAQPIGDIFVERAKEMGIDIRHTE